MHKIATEKLQNKVMISVAHYDPTDHKVLLKVIVYPQGSSSGILRNESANQSIESA